MDRGSRVSTSRGVGLGGLNTLFWVRRIFDFFGQVARWNAKLRANVSSEQGCELRQTAALAALTVLRVLTISIKFIDFRCWLVALEIALSITSLNRRGFLGASAAALALSALPRQVFAQEALPEKIRFYANPADYGQPYTTGILGLAHTLGYLEDEFAADGIALEFTYPAGSGPAVNEAIASGQADFGRYGGFPNITGKARGLPTKLLASVGAGHSYLVVNNNIEATTVPELKGLRVAIGRGTAPHLAFVRVLEAHGLTENDIELFDLEGGDELTAVASGAVDIGWGGSGFLQLVNDGNAKLVYTNRDTLNASRNFGGFLVTEDFASRYPQTTQRVVNAYVKAAHFAAQPENFDAVIEAYSKAGEDVATLQQVYEGLSFAEELSPIIDDYVRAQYQGGIDYTKANELIRGDIDLNTWIDTSFIDKAIADLGYEDAWTRRNADGSAA